MFVVQTNYPVILNPSYTFREDFVGLSAQLPHTILDGSSNDCTIWPWANIVNLTQIQQMNPFLSNLKSELRDSRYQPDCFLERRKCKLRSWEQWML